MMKSTETMQHFALEQELLLKELDREKVVKGKSKAVLLHVELLHRYQSHYFNINISNCPLCANITNDFPS